jgi:DNA-binding NarL/FixJ family response regulator
VQRDVRVVVVSRDALVGSALSSLLESDGSVQARVTTAQTVEGLLRAARDLDASTFVFEAGDDAERAGRLICGVLRDRPSSRVIAVVPVHSVAAATEMFAAGAQGVVGRDASPEEFNTAIDEVRAGHVFASRTVIRRIAETIGSPRGPSDGIPPGLTSMLSEREHTVVRLLLAGMSNQEISQHMHLAEATVKAHLSRVMVKWNARDRVQVVIRALGSSDTGTVTVSSS